MDSYAIVEEDIEHEVTKEEFGRFLRFLINQLTSVIENPDSSADKREQAEDTLKHVLEMINNSQV